MTASFTIAIACVMLAATLGVWLYVRGASHRQADQFLAENRAQIAREWDESHSLQNLDNFVREQDADMRMVGISVFAVDANNRVSAPNRAGWLCANGFD